MADLVDVLKGLFMGDQPVETETSGFQSNQPTGPKKKKRKKKMTFREVMRRQRKITGPRQQQQLKELDELERQR